ncbi:polyketide synthase [Paenibacillus dendritiformis C454]|uniref:Polyketide synthase n=1 Tax=Paenibacillus dendritiformis C454 TaxID=1131935 RepID=H3S9Z6_9BACL|nr:type I polyketide synthase [Paenibacillus dendritiformis]EHQ64020.1 polyketide synthase [Paenibacillus dendritiformis C454]
MDKGQDKRYKDICNWFVQQISALKQISQHEIKAEFPFSRYGLDSKELVSLSGELESFVKRSVDPTLFWDYPSIQAVARHFVFGGENGHAARDDCGAEQEDAIAVIGMGCRFPKSRSIDEYWHHLRSGENCITEMPGLRSSRFAQDGMHRAGIVEEIDLFDNEAFHLSPREAEQMDPQQRMLLEVVWEALEDAGLTNEAMNGSRTGVFVGISSNDYGCGKLSDYERSGIYTVTGNSNCIAANRISYIWNLRGPSMAVDTACSSSLVAVHLACQSLKTGETNMAIAGGVNVILNPAISKAFREAGMLSADGRCKTFDSRADGYVRGEGAGAVILKPLAAALRDRDRIYAVIRGSAVNQDGLSNGLTAPNGQAQEEVLQDAYRIAGLSGEEIDYIEAHGTGTALGDPIEVQAIGRVLSRNRSAASKCYIGSVKTNIGHLEAAAGIAGFIKTVLCLHYREWVPNLNLQEINPYIPLRDLPLQIVRDPVSWSSGSRPSVAGVSSFGFGGTNAHVVLQEYATSLMPPAQTSQQAPPSLHILPLSANSHGSLTRLAADMQRYLQERADASLDDICYTAQQRRTHRAWRAAVLGSNREELALGLERLTATCASADPSNLVFVFSGQGNQWNGMGLQYLSGDNAFTRTFLECDAIWSKYAGWSLWDELHRGADDAWADRTDAAQPLVFAVQASLLALWRSWGIEPKAVIGHSLGEISAHYAAGVLTLEDAMRIVYWRGTLMQSTKGQGAMVSIRMPLADIEQRLGEYPGVGISAVNGPSSIVLAGEAHEVERLLRNLPDTVKTHLLSSSFAFHSHLMEPLCDRLQTELGPVRYRLARLRIYSTVTGRMENGLRLGAEHWSDNMRKPVRFADALHAAMLDGYEAFVELGPHPVLTQHVEECGQDGEVKLAAFSMRRGDDGACMPEAAARLYRYGADLDWNAVGSRGQCIAIPTYPWEKRRLWIDDPEASERGTIGAVPDSQTDRARESSRHASSVQHILQAVHDRVETLPLLEEHLQGMFASVLKIIPASDLSLDRPLVMLGMDSIMALQLKHAIEQQFQVSLPIVQLLEGITTRQAASKLHGILLDARDRQSNEERSRIDDLLNSGDMERDLGELSDEDMERLLLLLTQEKGS